MRSLEEDASEDPSFSTAEIVALCTGDDRIMQYVELEAEVNQKKMLLSGWQTEIEKMNSRLWFDRHFSIYGLKKEINRVQKEINNLKPDVDKVMNNRGNCTGEAFQIEIGEEIYTRRVDAAKRLNAIADKAKKEPRTVGFVLVGSYGGFELSVTVQMEHAYLVLQGSNQHTIPLLRDVYKTMPRLEKDYLKLLQTIQDYQGELEQYQTRLEQLIKNHDKRLGKIEELRQKLVELEADKLSLEKELRLTETVDQELLVIDFADEE